MTVHKRKKKAVLDQTMHSVKWAHLFYETSCSWSYAQALPSHLLTNARLQERFTRRHSKLAQLIFSRSIANLLHCSMRVSVQARDLGHFKLLKVRKGTFTIRSQILSKSRSWGKIMTTRGPTSAPPSAAQFSLASKSRAIQKRLCKLFTNSLLTNILTTSASTSCPPFAINSVLTVIFGASKRSANSIQIRSWETSDPKSLEICSAVRCKNRLSKSEAMTRRQRHALTRSSTPPRLGRHSRLVPVCDETPVQCLHCRTFYVDPSSSDSVSRQRHHADPSLSDSVSKRPQHADATPSDSVSSQCHHHDDLSPWVTSKSSLTTCCSRRSTMWSPARSKLRSWGISRITSTRSFMTRGAVISTSCSTPRCCKRSSEMICTISTISV